MKYSIEELQALPNGDLSALAAELRGWKLSQGAQWWKYDDGRKVPTFTYNDTEGPVMPVSDWVPTANRDQSGELLREAAKRRCYFTILFCADDAMLYFGSNQLSVFTPNHRGRQLATIPGNDARAETIAFCAAMLAMKERLTQ